MSEPHTDQECARLLNRFLLEPAEFVRLLSLNLESDRAVISLVGDALWDIFAENHTVFDATGPYKLGTWRASAGFIADVLNRRYDLYSTGFDYLDFYMGSLTRQPQLEPIYCWIFTGLKDAGCDWIYSFPRLYLLRLDAHAACDAEHDSLAEELDRAHEESVLEARSEPLPPTVAAYRTVFGRLPEGWPHPDME